MLQWRFWPKEISNYPPEDTFLMLFLKFIGFERFREHFREHFREYPPTRVPSTKRLRVVREKEERDGRAERSKDGSRPRTSQGDRLMFREMHHMDRTSRAMDLVEKMADRRRQSLAATSRPPLKARMARMLS